MSKDQVKDHFEDWGLHMCDDACLRAATLSFDRMPEAIPRLLLTVNDAAAALSLSRSSLYEEIAAGRIESIHIGRAHRIPVDALRRWLDNKRRMEGIRSLPEFSAT